MNFEKKLKGNFNLFLNKTPIFKSNGFGLNEYPEKKNAEKNAVLTLNLESLEFELAIKIWKVNPIIVIVNRLKPGEFFQEINQKS
ncbi:hypothetical protein BpHYR1_018614 [Brachionus plicatilis]|uniref:Uncharacterized protein n=1 Tax=Brachionus plicatilis TaxID=10195 RepID=A0A3M7SJI5_BRAPC|nr:hypothetical protein BpHYR1_018614 [Brachionus plicatilis]